MRIVIPSYNRPESIKTHLLLDEQDYTIFLHNEEEKKRYLRNPLIDPSRVVITGVARGIGGARQWIQDNFLAKGEWYVSLDDNISHFNIVPLPQYDEPTLPVQEDGKFYNALFKTKGETKRFMEICEEMRQIAEPEQAYNCGFATTDNSYFNGNKHRWVGYVISKAAVRKNVGIPFEIEHDSMEDYGYTAECLKRYGRVLINNYVFPVAKHYEAGGIGTYEQRVERKISACEHLIRKYPGLLRYKVKRGCHPKAELAIRFTSTNQVDAWRNGHLQTEFI